MAIDFPDTPTTNQQFAVDDKTWIYDGTKWSLLSPAEVATGATGPTGPAGIVDALGYESGVYYTIASNTSTVGSFSNQQTMYIPFYVFKTTTWDRIACRTGDTFSGTATVRLGIYNNDSTTGKPSTVVLDAGTISCTVSDTIYAITISQQLTSGWYWLAFCTQGAASTNTFYRMGSATGFLNARVPTTFVNPVTNNAFTETGISGNFATAGTLSNTNAGPFVFLRAT